MATRRINVRAILADPDLRRRLMVSTIQATQAREGIDTTSDQAHRAYYIVTEAERAAFFALEPFKGSKRGDLDRRHEVFATALRAEIDGVRHDVGRRDFMAIDGQPLAYRQIGLVAHIFRENPPAEPTWGIARQGKATADDARWLRFRWEVAGRDGWVGFAKGGDFSRFYYDHDLVLDWRKENREELKASGNALPSEEHYFKAGLTWPRRTAKGFNMRVLPPGLVFADKGPAFFPRAPASQYFLLALMNSTIFEYLFKVKTSFSWEVGIIKTLPIPELTPLVRERFASLAQRIYDAKLLWDNGNEVSSSFDSPWVLRWPDAISLSVALNMALDSETEIETRIRDIYGELNSEAYRVYGIPTKTRQQIEKNIGPRPPEVLWPQMEGKTADQKRMEHVWRLLSFTVKRIVDMDDDGVIAFVGTIGDVRMVDRVREELVKHFPSHEEGKIEVEIVNELNRTVNGYRKCSSIADWLANVFFEYHSSLYKNRPIFWHIASSQGTDPCAFGALVNYHRFDKNRFSKLRSKDVRDTIEELRREVALADRAGRADDRVELQAKLEEVQSLDKRLQQIQEGHHEGPEGGERDFRILTPWKEPSARPRGWDPDLDDGVKVNIAPLDRAGVLRVAGVTG